MGFIWPGNTAKGLPTHNSVTVLFNQETGGVHAVIESGVVNAYRTAAADAVATNQLARQNAKTLAAFGAGNQAGYDCMAIARPWEQGRAALMYQDNGRSLVLALKHGDRMDLARPAFCRFADMNSFPAVVRL